MRYFAVPGKGVICNDRVFVISHGYSGRDHPVLYDVISSVSHRRLHGDHRQEEGGLLLVIYGILLFIYQYQLFESSVPPVAVVLLLKSQIPVLVTHARQKWLISLFFLMMMFMSLRTPT